MRKLKEAEIDRLRAKGYDLPAKNYWINHNIIKKSAELLRQLGYEWGTKDENDLHELDIIIREKELCWDNPAAII